MSDGIFYMWLNEHGRHFVLIQVYPTVDNQIVCKLVLKPQMLELDV